MTEPSSKIIQGLHDAKTSHESFWGLKAKVELANFRKQQKKVDEK